MSLWTIQVYEVLKNYALPSTNLDHDALIDLTYARFFNFNFPWYNSSTTDKENFEKLFLHHYLMNYIGQETLELFRMTLATRLREIMPYYIELYKTVDIDMDWYKNVDVSYTDSGSESRNMSGNNNRKSDTNIKTLTNSQSIDSDNPQITIQTEDYASSMSRGTSNGNTSTTEEINDSSLLIENIGKKGRRAESGYRGMTKGDVIKQMRETIVNINIEIINNCADLFLGLW